MSWSEQEYAIYMRRIAQADAANTSLAGMITLPLRHQSPYAPYRSRTEQRYAALLDVWQREGQVRKWRYEAMRLTLATLKTTLTIDFWLTRPDGRIELHEVKGFAREDAMVKLKVAAVLYPEWRIILVRWQKQAWTWKDIPCA